MQRLDSQNYCQKPTVGDDPCVDCAAREMTVCSVLDADELNALASIVDRIDFAVGEEVFAEDEPALWMYNVTDGMIKLYKLLGDGRRQIIGFLSIGDYMGLSMNDRYMYTAEAVTAGKLCRFRRKDMEELLQRFPKLQARLFSMTSDELAAAQDQMMLLGRKTAKEKICSFLLKLSERAVKRKQGANPVHVPMSRSDIADYLGLTTETVSRSFTQLKKAGVIQLQEGGWVEMRDLDFVHDEADGMK